MRSLLLLLLFSFSIFYSYSQCIVAAPVPDDACYQTVIANDSYCCDVDWDGICQSAYDDCDANSGGGGGGGGTDPGDGCVSDVSICTPGQAGPFAFDQETPGPPTDFADPVGCSTGLFGNDFGFGFILLQITTSGPLNLLVDGDASSGYIDVVVYDIPSGTDPCVAVMDNANEIGCNYATSSIGCTQFGNDFSCASSIAAPNVVAGQTIMIIVHDYSTMSNNFTLELGPTGAQTGPPDGTINAITSVCLTDSPFQMTAIDMGGDWTGPGINESGMFDPASAGVGTHTINYTIGSSPCIDSDQTTITVTDCSVPCEISYSQPAYCQDESDPTPILVGDWGGTFSSTSGLVINPSTGVIDLSASSPGTYSISYAPPGSSSCGPIAPVSVTINALPTITLTTDDVICNGESITLTAGGASTYSWTPTGTLDSSTGSSVSATPNSTTVYTVTGSTTGGCQSSASVEITVEDIPVVNAGVDQSICDGESVTLNGSTTTGTMSWSDGITNITPFQPTVGTHTYTLTATTPAGCTNTDDVTITVNTNPIPQIIGDPEYCTGTSALLNVNNQYANYSWSNASTNSSISGTTSMNPITVTVTDANGCTGISPPFNTEEVQALSSNSTVEICQGESAMIHGQLETVAGDYTEFFSSADACDSVSTVTLIVHELPTINAGIDQELCSGESTSLWGSGATNLSWSGGIIDGQSLTPADGANQYTLTGIDENGCQNTDDVVVMVNALPTVDAGENQDLCDGESTILMGSGATSYTWNNNVVDNTSFTPLSTLTYTVIGTDINGCENSDDVLVTIHQNPTINAGNDVEICESESVILYATGALTYQWSSGDANGDEIWPSVGDFVYTVTGTDVMGCQGSDQLNIIVNPLPSINAGQDQNLCAGTETSLNASGGITYSWSPYVVDGSTFQPSVGSTTYTVTGTDLKGCSNTDDVTINIYSLPVINAGNDTTICINQSVILTGSGGSGGTYIWDNGVTNGVSFVPGSTMTYNVLYTDSYGCEDVDDIVVSVIPIPTINAGEDVTGCENDLITLTGSGAGINGTYTWTGGIQNGTSFPAQSGVQQYTVTGTDQYGCSNTDQVVVAIESYPTLSFDFVVDGNCAPVQVQLMNTSQDATTNCNWSINHQLVSQGCDGFSIVLDQIGLYTVGYSAESMNYGCYSEIEYQDIIQVDPNPDASFEVDDHSVSSFHPSFDFTNTSTYASNYEWIFGDGYTSSEENPSHTYDNDPQHYTVYLITTNEFGCTDTTAQIVQVEEELIFYMPNTFTPDGDEFNQHFQPVFASGYDPYDFTFLVFNRWGEIVFESHDASKAWDGTYAATGEVCPSGTYTWTLEFKLSMNDERANFAGHFNLLK